MDMCDLYVGYNEASDRYRAHCTIHDTEGQWAHRTSREAHERFTCDKGEKLRFLVTSDEPDSFLGFCDLGETVYQLRALIEDRAAGYGNIDEMKAWRIVHTSPLNLELRPTTVVCIDAGLYHFRDENGQLITEFFVHFLDV